MSEDLIHARQQQNKLNEFNVKSVVAKKADCPVYSIAVEYCVHNAQGYSTYGNFGNDTSYSNCG